MRPAKKSQHHSSHISLDYSPLIGKNPLESGLKYEQDYLPNNATGAEWIRFPREGSRHKQVK